MVTWLIRFIKCIFEFIVGWLSINIDYIFLFMKGLGGNMNNVSNLAINYASLIVDGYKTFSSAHRRLKPDVATCLICWGYPDLITEEAYKPKM